MFIPFNWDYNDYYIVFNWKCATSDDSEFTWNPDTFQLVTYDHNRNEVYTTLDFKEYCYCNANSNGFTLTATIPEMDNTAIQWLRMVGSGTVAKNSYYRCIIVEMPKTSASGEAVDNSAIIDAIATMEQTLNQSITSGFDELYEQSQMQHEEVLHGYNDSALNDASNRFTEGAGELKTVEEELTVDSKQYVNDFTSTGFDAGVLLTLGSSLTFLATWFTNFWNMGGVWTSGLTFCFALTVAFIILKVRK